METFRRSEMTAEECIDKITEVLSRDITISEGPQFHVDGSSTTIINPGTDLLDRLMDISSIVKEYYKKGNK